MYIRTEKTKTEVVLVIDEIGRYLGSASEVSAADPIANPLPIAAVVLPTESSLSVISLTYGGRSHISAIPPALSAIGP